MKEIITLLPKLADKKVMVIGDLCLDEYIIGVARRLSREAPVPILEFQRRFTVPGEAANPALNIRALGGMVFMVGVVGDDEAGSTLMKSLAELGIDTQGVVVDPSRLTTLKTRVLAEGSLLFPQQLVRVDREERRPLDAPIEEELISHVRSIATEVDAMLLSDYKGGVVEGQVIDTVLKLAKAHNKIATVDSQGNLFKFHGFTVVKCNREEAQNVLGRELTDDEGFGHGGRELQEQLTSEAVVITRGSDGMSLVDSRGSCSHIPAANRSEVFDVTGAGDTVIATLTLAMAAGASIAQAAYLSNQAAGLVVRKLGNATTTLEELEKAILAEQGDLNPG